MSLSVTVVIPVYNASATLEPLVLRLKPVLSACADRFEAVLVDDGSADGSWEVIERLHMSYPWIRGLRLMRNYGQHNATLCGIREARGDVIVTMDDDLQNPPEAIPVLLAELDRGFDVVYGSPRVERHGLWRDLASRITKLALQSALGAKTARQVTGFRAFRTHLRAAFADFRGAFVSIDVLLTWATTRFSACLVEHDVRRVGRSNYTFLKLVMHALNMMTGFSTLPLQFASLLGFAATIFGFGLLCFVLTRYLIHGVVLPGFTFLASVICIFSGTQLFALGMMGEYLARMHYRMMEKPAYAVVRRTCDVAPDVLPRP